MKKQNLKMVEQKRELNNVIKFSSVTKTKNGFAIWIGPNVIFLNQGLLNYIRKQAK